MDQTACAVGGFIAIDFEDPAAPGIEKLDFDLRRMGYGLCIVDTGGNHADLNEDYASVPAEMKAVAKLLGHSVLRECDEEELISKISAVRAGEGDRALLRALHFFGENRRVEKETDALRRKDIKEFFKVIRSSGLSSFCWLQNVYSAKNPREQGLSLALCLTEKFFGSECTDAAWRVHGGGFAGKMCIRDRHVVVDYCHDRGRQHEQNKYNRKYFVFHLRLRFFMPHCADYFGQTR